MFNQNNRSYVNRLSLIDGAPNIVSNKSYSSLQESPTLLDKVEVSISSCTYFGFLPTISENIKGLGYPMSSDKPFGEGAGISFWVTGGANGRAIYGCTLRFNGMRFLRAKLEPDSLILNNSDDNSFENEELYQIEGLLEFQKRQLELLIIEAKALLVKTSPRWTNEHKINISVKKSELCSDLPGQDFVNIQTEMKAIEQIFKLYPEMSFGGLEPSGTARGIRFNIGRNIIFRLYRKRDSKILRTELAYDEHAIKLLTNQFDDISDKIDRLIEVTITHRERILNNDNVSAHTFSYEEALERIGNFCPKNFSKVLPLLKKGKIRNKTKDKTYSSIRLLAKHKVLIKCEHEVSTYRLSEAYYPILTNQLETILKDRSSISCVEQIYAS